MLTVLQTALEVGLIYGLVALALFISFSILNIADLSTDGCFTLGCAVGAMLTIAGHPILALFAAMAAGMLSGYVTAFLQTRLGVESILAGIISNTGLYTINLAVMGFSSNVSITGVDTVFSLFKGLVGGQWSRLILLALIAAVVSIVVKEGLYWYTIAAAKRIRSVSLKAEAWHHRSDALSSIGSFAGVLGARLGVPILDPIASIVICLFIFKVAYGIFHESIDRLVDRACDADTVAAMRATMLRTPGVVRVDDLKTRLFGSRTYVDAEIAVDGALPLRDAHVIAEAVHHELERDYPDVKHCTVHVNPA